MTYRHRVATVFLFGFFLDLINMFIASIAFPAISRALAVSVSQLAWVSNAYILGLTVVVPFSAWLSERWGAKRLFLLSLGLFSLGALAAGLANSLSELILWRTLQGMGGGLLIPLGQALTWPLFQPHERAKLSAAVMLVGLLAPACSPAIGGLLVGAFSWRWVFYASLPVALLTFVLAVRWLNDTPGPVRPTRFLSLSLLADPLLRFAMLIYLCVPGMFIGVNVVGMYYLQRVTGMAPGAIGALMVPWSLASFARHHFYRQIFQPLRAPAAGRHRLPASGDGDHAAAEDRCGQPAGAVDSGLYADGRRRQLMQQHRAKQRFPAYACRRDA
ncbi:major facilitator family transporter [Klebsiella pneumoniae]|uniref:Major facilitator family transporter n=1 Tax=Klebsiella pneumoniae TaxID=573 RepID=A0A2X3KKR3_KLEPN|nr:major facilitator family transporter [Klebsiella pneumoniae]